MDNEDKVWWNPTFAFIGVGLRLPELFTVVPADLQHFDETRKLTINMPEHNFPHTFWKITSLAAQCPLVLQAPQALMVPRVTEMEVSCFGGSVTKSCTRPQSAIFGWGATGSPFVAVHSTTAARSTTIQSALNKEVGVDLFASNSGAHFSPTETRPATPKLRCTNANCADCFPWAPKCNTIPPLDFMFIYFWWFLNTCCPCPPQRETSC